jgi:hypothetical protein
LSGGYSANPSDRPGGAALEFRWNRSYAQTTDVGRHMDRAVLKEAETERREAIKAQAETNRSRAAEAGQKFKVLGRNWHYAHLSLAWGAAALAGIASVSLVSDRKWLTATFAIASALIGAANAAFNPGRKSRRAYKLAFDYIHVGERAEEFVRTRVNYVSLDEASQELASIREALEHVDDLAVRTHGEE